MCDFLVFYKFRLTFYQRWQELKKQYGDNVNQNQEYIQLSIVLNEFLRQKDQRAAQQRQQSQLNPLQQPPVTCKSFFSSFFFFSIYGCSNFFLNRHSVLSNATVYHDRRVSAYKLNPSAIKYFSQRQKRDNSASI